MDANKRKSKRTVRAGRPSRASAGQRQQQLLAVALDVFLAAGYEAASLNHIAKVSGVSRDTIYRQYKSKAALFRAATTHAFREMSGHLESAIQPQEPPEIVLDRVIRYIHRDTADSYHNQVIRLSLSESYRSSEMAGHVLEASREFLRPLSAYLAEQKRRGVLRLEDPDETALILASMVAGGGHFFVGRLPETSTESDTWCDQMLDWILYGLKRS